MFDYDPPKEKEPVDYTGLKIVGILAPVFFLITFLSNADMGLAACIVLGMVMLAIKIRWQLRKRVWFWAIIGFILALHIPLILVVRWPQGNVPTLFYTMPLGIADFLIISGALGLAERFFSKGRPSS
jgi:4-amino-4-deoxy-L-arabinose transferase-like glycosyltransferase